MILRQLPAMLAVSSSRVAVPYFSRFLARGSLNEELISRDWSFQPQGKPGEKATADPAKAACAAREMPAPKKNWLSLS
jgi:hypothetical protein